MLKGREWYARHAIEHGWSRNVLVHQIESGQLDALPGNKTIYASWEEHRQRLEEILQPYTRLAMQYSPENRIPAISMVDAGTVELVRSLGNRALEQLQHDCPP